MLTVGPGSRPRSITRLLFAMPFSAYSQRGYAIAHGSRDEQGGGRGAWNRGGKGGDRQGDDQRGRGHGNRQRRQQRRDGYGFQPGDGQPPQPDGGDGQPPQPPEPREGPVVYNLTDDEVWMANTKPGRWREMPEAWNMPIRDALQDGSLALDGLPGRADDGPEVFYKVDFTDIDAVTVQSTKNWKTHEIALYRRVQLMVEAPPAASSHDEANTDASTAFPDADGSNVNAPEQPGTTVDDEGFLGIGE